MQFCKSNVFFKNVSFCKSCKRSYVTQNVRVRFAPSPTGFLHLGGLRTAIYNYFFAKKHNGKFILRIEDTDQTRIVPGAIEQLQNDLRWSGIEIDEGPTEGGDFGPYIQSQRLQIYRDQVNVLLNNGSAYQCFCTDSRLNLLRKQALKQQEVPKYDNRCRHLTSEEVRNKINQGKPSCIRFKISDKDESFDDLIYGRITCNISLNEGDPVILKTDGYPTYHLANVVDDHFMNISHVLRGVEWQISTTKHILLYRALNWTPPSFGHLPLLMNSDGTKLSKRQGDIRITHYKDSGIFPQTLINFIVHSGGGFTKDLQTGLKPQSYSMEELTEQFNIDRINSHSGKIMQDRLLEFNKLELEKKINEPKDLNRLVGEVKTLLIKTYPHKIENNTLQYDDEHIKNILKWAFPRINTLSELTSRNLEFVWFLPSNMEVKESNIEIISSFVKYLESEDLTKDHLSEVLKEFCKKHNVSFGSFMKTIRYALSGLKEGPSVAEMMSILGKRNTLERLEMSINKSKS